MTIRAGRTIHDGNGDYVNDGNGSGNNDDGCQEQDGSGETYHSSDVEIILMSMMRDEKLTMLVNTTIHDGNDD